MATRILCKAMKFLKSKSERAVAVVPRGVNLKNPSHPFSQKVPRMSGRYSRDSLSVAYLKIFLEENKSTVTKSTLSREVCDQIVKVEAKSGTYIEYLLQLDDPNLNKYIDKATVFASHTWSGKFHDLVEALSAWCTENKVKEEDTFVWIDIFCMDQHDEQPTHAHLVENFKHLIEKISKAVIVLEPWPQDINAIREHVPVWATRIWCLFEFAMFRETPTIR
jgi:hypothetical protein